MMVPQACMRKSFGIPIIDGQFLAENMLTISCTGIISPSVHIMVPQPPYDRITRTNIHTFVSLSPLSTDSTFSNSYK